jgi:hypothetical protein
LLLLLLLSLLLALLMGLGTGSSGLRAAARLLCLGAGGFLLLVGEVLKHLLRLLRPGCCSADAGAGKHSTAGESRELATQRRSTVGSERRHKAQLCATHCCLRLPAVSLSLLIWSLSSGLLQKRRMTRQWTGEQLQSSAMHCRCSWVEDLLRQSSPLHLLLELGRNVTEDALMAQLPC